MISHDKFEAVVTMLRKVHPVDNAPFCVLWNIGTKTARIGLGVEMKHAVNIDQLGGMSVEGIVNIIVDMFPIKDALEAKKGVQKALDEYVKMKNDPMSPGYCGPDGWTGD